MFYIKKILGIALDPLSLSILLIFAGLILLMMSKKKQGAGKFFYCSRVDYPYAGFIWNYFRLSVIKDGELLPGFSSLIRKIPVE